MKHKRLCQISPFGYHVGLSQSTFPAESATKEITRVNFKLNNGVFQFYHLAAGMPPREHTVKLNLPSTPFTRSRSDIFAILAKKSANFPMYSHFLH